MAASSHHHAHRMTCFMDVLSQASLIFYLIIDLTLSMDKLLLSIVYFGFTTSSSGKLFSQDFLIELRKQISIHCRIFLGAINPKQLESFEK